MRKLLGRLLCVLSFHKWTYFHLIGVKLRVCTRPECRRTEKWTPDYPFWWYYGRRNPPRG